MTRVLNKIDIKALEEEYKPNGSIWNEDDGKIHRLKTIVRDLEETDKRIILLYAELQSQRKVAKLLGISTSLVNIKVNEIRRKILDEYHN